MKLIKATINIAFHDIEEMTADKVLDDLSEVLVDRYNAELGYFESVRELQIGYPDPDIDNDSAPELGKPDVFELWQAEAAKKLENL